MVPDNSLDFMPGTSLLSREWNAKVRAYLTTSKENIAVPFGQLCDLIKYSLTHGKNLNFINLFYCDFKYTFTFLVFEKTHTIYESIKQVFVSDYTGKVCLSL